MKPHFYKAYSRLGMKSIPIGGSALNIGVEEGPDAVLSPSFLAKFGDFNLTTYAFELPEGVGAKDYEAVIALSSEKLAKLINSTLEPGETQVVVGGDHSVAFGSLLALTSRVPLEKIGYVQLDSHGDVHLFATSPTGNFHGMWLRPFLTQFDSEPINQKIIARLNPDQILFIGNLQLEKAEQDLFDKNKIASISSLDLSQDRSRALGRLEKFVSRFEHMHISFDVDVFHKDIVSATGTPAKNGFQPEDIFDVVKVLQKASSKSIDLVEVNPRKDQAASTIEVSRRVLLGLCKP